MKLHNTQHTKRLSLLSKQVPNRKYPDNQASSQKTNKNASRPYRFAKLYQKQQQRKQEQRDQEEYLKKLRQEAFADLQLQLQHYNDEFISRMRYIENNRGHLAASPSTESLCSTSSTSSSTSTSSSSDDSVIMHDLVELFEAGTVKDYTPLIEWELCRNPPTYFESQGEYGDLW